MRFTVFLAFIVVTFVACTSNFAQASTLAQDYTGGNVDRRLRAAAAPVNKDNVAKIAGGFLTKIKEGSKLTKAEQMIKNTNGDEAAVKKAILMASTAKESAKMSDESIAKLSAMITTVVVKDPKSWPRLKKFVKVALGAGVGGLALYGAYKLLFNKESSSGPVTTTTGSADMVAVSASVTGSGSA
ncbi:hypothetical protein P3T76_009103 [Phytophthora citrophthora]|uniref:RxLR effector protein n=1 Tax=Phytophthora citrophthora TaxID=4793 RepID=A0AAD9GIG9_9STRA|nr:hypothetical protein P3T76_009103 [Phytophthora citrophthora]